MLESYKWQGWDWKSLQALILRAPLCGANNHVFCSMTIVYDNQDNMDSTQIMPVQVSCSCIFCTVLSLCNCVISAVVSLCQYMFYAVTSQCNCVFYAVVSLCCRLICRSVQWQYVIALITPTHDAIFPWKLLSTCKTISLSSSVILRSLTWQCNCYQLSV